jgi:hypothetical protein
MMTSAARPRRALRALFGLSWVAAAGLASCANGETGVPDGASGGATARGGFAGFGATGTPAAGHSQGGSSGAGGPAGGSGNNAGSGNATGLAGTGTGGSSGSGGNAGTLGVAGTLGSAGSGETSGTGGQLGSGGTSAGGNSGGGAGRSAGGFGQGGRGGNGSGGKSNGGMSNGGMSSGGMGGAWGVAPPANIQNGQQGWASRYWDCCKATCGWTSHTNGGPAAHSCDKNNNQTDANSESACTGGPAFACWNDRPWAVGDKLAYGFVAKNDTCGRCYHLQFTGSTHNAGDNAGAKALSGKHMIVQVINTGGIASDQMDLLIPGGGVGANNACSNQWGTSDLGAQYGGFLAGCNGDLTCVKNKCQQVFAGKQDLLDGCDWFLGWFSAADNPSFTYEKVSCPQEITQHSGLNDPG